MTRPTRKPWADRASVEAVTHEPRPSGLVEAWAMLAADGPVRLDDLAREAMLSASYTGPADAVRAIADALDAARPGVVRLGGVPLVGTHDDDSAPMAYRWPRDFIPRGRKRPGGVEDCTVLAALAVGVALCWGRSNNCDPATAAERIAALEAELERLRGWSGGRS